MLLRHAGLDLLVPLFGSLVFSQPAVADLIVTGRETHLAVHSVFGSVDGTVSESVTLTEHDLDADLQTTIQDADSGSGASGDVSWAASYEFRLDQEFIPGTPEEFGGAASMNLFAFAADAGIASLSASPGNRLIVDFENTEAGSFDVECSVTANSSFALDRIGPGGFVENLYLRAGDGVFSETFELVAGDYRVTAVANADTTNAQASGESWSFRVRAVPEPTIVGGQIAGLALLAGIARARRVRARSRARHAP